MTTRPTPTLTSVQLRILRILHAADTPLWPLAVAHATAIPYGTVYQTCRTFYDLGWVVGVTESNPTKPIGRPARVLYRLTRQGRTQAAALLGTAEGEETPA